MITPTERSAGTGELVCARPVWVFAEERSGSTWLSHTLALGLKRRYRYLEMDQEEVSDLEWAQRVRDEPERYFAADTVFQTHRFAVLASLPGKPVVLRTTRRDAFEHILSWFFLESTRRRYPEFWRLPHLAADTDTRHFRNIVESSRGLTVTRVEVEAWFAKKRERDTIWRQHASAYDAQTIFYEDLVQGVAIRHLDTLLSFATGSDVRKLPYDKRALFVNLEQIRDWVSECARGLEPVRGNMPATAGGAASGLPDPAARSFIASGARQRPSGLPIGPGALPLRPGAPPNRPGAPPVRPGPPPIQPRRAFPVAPQVGIPPQGVAMPLGVPPQGVATPLGIPPQGVAMPLGVPRPAVPRNPISPVLDVAPRDAMPPRGAIAPVVPGTGPLSSLTHPAGESLAAATRMTAAPQPAGPTATQKVLHDTPEFKMFQETHIVEI